MRRTVIALLLLVSGAAATAVAQPAKQNPPAQGHCAVGVQSRLGEEFEVGNKKVSVESWHIDDLVVDRVRAALGKRAVVQRIPYRKEAVVWWQRFVDNANSFRRMAAGTRCARYIVVSSFGSLASDCVSRWHVRKTPDRVGPAAGVESTRRANNLPPFRPTFGRSRHARYATRHSIASTSHKNACLRYKTLSSAAKRKFQAADSHCYIFS